MKKYLLSALVVTSLAGTAFAQAPKTPPPHPAAGMKRATNPHANGPKIDDKTRECLEKNLGKPGEGAPPTKEKFEAAMKACNIAPPPAGH